MTGLSDSVPSTSPPKPCISCGAPATDESALCTACQPALKGFIGPAVDVADEPFVIQDRLCRTCGYNLSGVRSDRECPECGTPALRSLQGNLLRFSSLEYVKQLHLGTLIALIAAVSFTVIMLLILGLEIFADALGMGANAVDFVTQGLSLASSITSIVGWWMLSTPDPALVSEDHTVNLRRLLRTSLIIDVVFSTAHFALLFILPAHIGVGSTASGFLYLVSVPTWLLRFFSSLSYLRTVAFRLPDAELSKHASRFMWLGPVVTVFTCGLGFIFAYISYIILLNRARTGLRNTIAAIQAAPRPF